MVAVAGTENRPTAALSEAQLADFWNGIIANEGAAKRMAGSIVRPDDVEDVVSSASILFVESLGRAENPTVPRDAETFRRRYLTIVKNHALDCVRDPQAGENRPVHTSWGVEHEPIVGGRKIADRPLDQVFARNDENAYDAPAPPEARPEDNVDRLEQILMEEVDRLTPMQRTIIRERYVEGRKRAEVAERNGISVKTYDAHLQAAFFWLRDNLWYAAFIDDDVGRSKWSDLIEELSARHDDADDKRMAQQRAELEAMIARIPGIGAEVTPPSAEEGAPNAEVGRLDVSVAAQDASVIAPDVSVSALDVSVSALDVSVARPDVSVATPADEDPGPDVSVPAPAAEDTPLDVSVAAPAAEDARLDVSVTAPDVRVAPPDVSVAAPEFSVPAPDASVAALRR
jgi:RNA polymerase sigma factor (sigma-70 family)